MGKDKLDELIKKYGDNREYYHDSKNAYNETECRDEYISPLLECFGWDVENSKGKLPQYKEVVVEKFSNSSERPDYTLTLNGVSKIHVEAKKPSVDILVETDPAMQTRKYGWNANHPYAVLTNFENLSIYDTTNQPHEGDDARASLYRVYNYKDYLLKYAEIYELIGRDNLYNGSIDEFVKKTFKDSSKYSTEVDETFLKQINEWRLALGDYLYSKDEKYKDLKILNETVQSFINQIIFLRICEDRKLPLYRKLYEIIADKATLQQILTEIFKKADKRYNSGLFEGDSPIFDLKVEIIDNIIKSLYYPQTPYLFTVLEPSILGKIYEAFLTESLVVVDGKIKLAQKSEYRYKSVVSTPVEIVKYMVKTVMDKKCQGKTPKEILDLRVADIACGSGVFLEEAYQYLIDYCTGWYEVNESDHLIEIEEGKKKLPLAEKKKLLSSCIFGVDIDSNAVEVCKLSLLLKLLEGETEPSVKEEDPILPDLANNIVAGNSLVENKDINRGELSVEQLVGLVPFDWATINSGNGFDVILGNPPYVNTEDMHRLSGEIEFNVYKKKYKSSYLQFDKYFLFVEKAMSLLIDDGMLCYIIPNKFPKIKAGKELRKLLAKHLVSIDDFGDAQLFPDKTIYSAIVIAQKEKSAVMKYSYVKNVVDLWTGSNISSIDLNTKIFDENPWLLTTEIDFLKMLDKTKDKAIPLSDVANIFNGIQTSAERAEKFSDKKEVYWFDGTCIYKEDNDFIYVERFGKKYKVEKSILKPYFKPTKNAEKGMTTYSLLETDKRIIFPYDKEGKLFSIDEMKSTFAGTYAYLLDCYDRLVPRCLNDGIGRDVPDATEDTWYKYGRTQALTSFIDTEKLIVRVLSKEPMYAYDKTDMLIASGGTAGYVAISKKKESKYELEYIQAWLAHPYTEKIFQIQGSDFEGGFTARGTFLLNKIPFVDLDFNNADHKKLYDDVVSKTRRIYELNEQLKGHIDRATKNVIENEKGILVEEIQTLIKKVYEQEI